MRYEIRAGLRMKSNKIPLIIGLIAVLVAFVWFAMSFQKNTDSSKYATPFADKIKARQSLENTSESNLGSKKRASAKDAITHRQPRSPGLKESEIDKKVGRQYDTYY